MIQISKIQIDTTLGYKEHREVINSEYSCICSEDKPKQFFTEMQPVPDERKEVESIERFYELKYNEKGDVLNKIEYWDYEYVYFKEEVKVGCNNKYYFTKNDEEVKTEIVTDTKTHYTDHTTLWDSKKNLDSGIDVLPTQTRRKKRFGIF